MIVDIDKINRVETQIVHDLWIHNELLSGGYFETVAQLMLAGF